MKKEKKDQLKESERGISHLELLIVFAIIAVVSTLAIPQLVGSRNALRFAALPREVMTQMRFARQHAMSQRRAVTFQYSDANRELIIIRHTNVGADGIEGNADDIPGSGQTVLTQAGYPMTPNATRVRSVPLAVGGITRSEIVAATAVPGAPTAPTTLGDTTPMTALTSGTLNITFQPDGSVIDSTGNPVNFALFFHSTRRPRQTASAVSVRGAGGRIKFWRFADGATPSYIE
ncbi:MAG: GspH/FimT family pseudopilin [Pyrinomonadaceae bacterium MAG19_C2-C3]|nr:GspH/FimT family pseudopilin [Pyrinomonadaceae bacterium MAG19_C2-C3]